VGVRRESAVRSAFYSDSDAGDGPSAPRMPSRLGPSITTAIGPGFFVWTLDHVSVKAPWWSHVTVVRYMYSKDVHSVERNVRVVGLTPRLTPLTQSLDLWLRAPRHVPLTSLVASTSKTLVCSTSCLGGRRPSNGLPKRGRGAPLKTARRKRAARSDADSLGRSVGLGGQTGVNSSASKNQQLLLKC
jgi:hypothetical protein